jgi:hypothetical protein
MLYSFVIINYIAFMRVSKANNQREMKMKTKIRIETAGGTGFEFWAVMSNGQSVSIRTSYNPAAWGQFCSAIGSITGQTNRGVIASLKKWIS